MKAQAPGTIKYRNLRNGCVRAPCRDFNFRRSRVVARERVIKMYKFRCIFARNQYVNRRRFHKRRAKTGVGEEEEVLEKREIARTREKRRMDTRAQ